MTAPLFLSEADVRALVGVDDAIRALDACFSAPAESIAVIPRQRAPLPGGPFQIMAATYAPRVFGLKAYCGAPQGTFYNVLLYSYADRRLLALVEANLLSQIRTGAATGLATRLMARADARSLGIIGTGKQAFWQVAAIAVVRPVSEVRVYGRDRERRIAFARRIEAELGIAARPVESAEACVRGADVVVTITNAREPVCLSHWVAEGTHVNAAGANAADRREVDGDLVTRAALRVTDDLAQARVEAAEFRDLADAGALDWADVRTLSDLLRVPHERAPQDITLFKSLGVAIEDVALAEVVYARALAEGRGRAITSGCAATKSGETP
ncbi:ornithine cyclodeaminase family protein [Xanthobacter dioxanivorans]|uniref:Ornithine cyclodeaminase family protein n=1 Tax=Xanthobacter dioxanivorans TaxID=2528964 RepID=A0A974PMJ1_9HYPH|nr:ornithine cyclodeaminase family protein [Xanthobacter dioxanivorans]QRG06342.1 ornithine cyclodeaminase family protein [Xanthobacter dioxanivorans]